MNIKMIGIDHTLAPLDVRQAFAFTRKGAVEAMERLRQREGVNGCVLLSTCNRTELWLDFEEEADEPSAELLCGLKQADPKEYRRFFTCRENGAAVEHLFRLAGGLLSRVMGEDQILTQVKEAAALAREHYCASQPLEVLFRMAVTAGKRVKTSVPMARANSSAAHQALASLKEQGYEVSGKTCLVIGNGEMGRLTAMALKEAGAAVTVTVRQYRSGVVNIPEGCARIHYGERYGYIPECAVVCSATASPNYTITAEELKGLASTRSRIYLDLAVPRDIEPAVGELPGARLFDIDSFRIDPQSEAMKRQYGQADEILKEMQAQYISWYECRDLIPRVGGISEQAAEDILWRAGRAVKELDLTKERQQVLNDSVREAAAKAVGKLLYRLRDSLSPQEFRRCLDALDQTQPESPDQERN